jgi:hypothetical protein
LTIKCVGRHVDKRARMHLKVSVNGKAEIMPFGVLRANTIVQIALPQEEERPSEPTILEPTTLVDRVITSAPGRLFAS